MNRSRVFSRPQKFVLYMAQSEDDWSGKVQSFDWDEEYRFASLEDLRDWLNEHQIDDKVK